MISEMMDYCNNHFLCTSESPELTFKDTSGTYTIEGTLLETYLVGQFIYISKSILNDGAYKITIVETDKLTVTEEVFDEVSNDAFLFGCAVPKAFIALDVKIIAWELTNGGLEGISSEKIDDYSISFGKTSSGGSGVDGWQGAFSSRLNKWRAPYDDIESVFNGYYYGYR